MRIFYASGSTPNGALPASIIWRSNLYGALVDLGHDVIEFDFDLAPLIAAADTSNPRNRRFVDRHRPRATEALLEQLRRAHAQAPVDLFFSYFYSSCTTPQAILDIRALGITAVNWYCNASYQLHLVEDIAPAYDACLVPERFRLGDYERLGAHPIYCQEAANPVFYRPISVERDLDVVFVGARYGDRAHHVRRLLDAGVNVRVFGPGWVSDGRRRKLNRVRPRHFLRKLRAMRGNEGTGPLSVEAPEIPPQVCGGVLADEDIPRVYSRAKIVLGFSSVGNTHASNQRVTQIRLRDFEAPMCGAFYIVEQMPELAEFFDVGREIVTYRDADELVDKCFYYLEHSDARERIRLAGHARVLRDHTWQCRFTDVFRQLGLQT